MNPIKMKDEQIDNRVVTLHGMGWSIRHISRELGISRRRIDRILASKSVLRDAMPGERIKQRKQRVSKLDPYKPLVDELLTKGVWNGRVMLRKIQARGYTGKETILRDYLKPKRAFRERKATVRFETAPG